MRHFCTLADLSPAELHGLVDRAVELKNLRGTPAHPRPLENKTVAILLEKASTRTRLSFEVGIGELGGRASTLIARYTQLHRGEALSDTAKMLSGYVHGVIFRTREHARIEELRDASTIPVINGLSDLYHPCQLLADLQTLKTHFGRLEGLRVAWIGDGNNMVHSWMLASALTGLELRVCTPPGYAATSEVVERARGLGATIRLGTDPNEAVAEADVVTTDVWASMGQEDEAERRREAFAGFTVDAALMKLAHPAAVFLHCLPAHRGEEVAADVLDGSQSLVWAEAENRLHSQKALLELLIETV